LGGLGEAGRDCDLGLVGLVFGVLEEQRVEQERYLSSDGDIWICEPVARLVNWTRQTLELTHLLARLLTLPIRPIRATSIRLPDCALMFPRGNIQLSISFRAIRSLFLKIPTTVPSGGDHEIGT
jgi:hypothetical protein